MNSIKLLKSSLRSDTEEANVEHALQFLNVAINDFPAEYFLQPPYIFFVSHSALCLLIFRLLNIVSFSFQSLKSLVDKKNRYATEVLQRLSHLTLAFRKRIIMRNLSKVYCPDNRVSYTRINYLVDTYHFDKKKTCFRILIATLNRLPRLKYPSRNISMIYFEQIWSILRISSIRPIDRCETSIT